MDEEGCDEHAEVTILHELVADFEPYAEIEEVRRRYQPDSPEPTLTARSLTIAG